ncbi:penicillin-binding protein 1A [Fodinicurvata sediminis]|uniref:penicillin-binding protein 1A n=1 Tax=Fodinicurvata sediminis TaxID=1121832 RepID=UPI0003B651C4|nr:penicillin-binding protein 1A [Fodinicurvata sediminis]
MFIRLLSILFGALVLGLVVAAGAGLYLFHHYGKDLPDYEQLADYQPPTVTRVHAGDGRLLDELAIENRIFVPMEAMPDMMKQAFIAAEDQNFYSHPGIDVLSIVRAAITNLRNLGTNQRPVGASTITQQVAKNFLLSNEVSLERKIREAILSIRMERALPKDRILELYLNEIYLGMGSYGVASAAINYFNKSMDELTLDEVAYLAALPKAPSNYHPIRKKEAAIARRNWVLGRMLEDEVITEEQAETARAADLEIHSRDATEVTRADFFSEEVRRKLVKQFGDDQVYNGGMSVRTSLDPELQEIARKTLRDGLISYDRRHGWRGALGQIEFGEQGWAQSLNELPIPPSAEPWNMAAVLELDESEARIGLTDGSRGRIPMSELTWARPALENQAVGAQPSTPSDVLEVGDVILVEALEAEQTDGESAADNAEAQEESSVQDYGLRQIPAVNGALVALNPHTGRVLAMQGGFSFAQSEFNRATQAMRQPGSSFKPFVYLTALNNGFTPSTIILDAPFVADQGPGLGKWRPSNYTNRFYGPTPMRIGIEKSRNLMTVRLAQTVGIEKVANTAERFGVFEHDVMPTLSLALGAGETTALRLTAAYAKLVNGGKEITPTFIDRVQGRLGQTLFRNDDRSCEACRNVEWNGQAPPRLPDDREQIVSPGSAYQVVSMLEGVVQRGTATTVAQVGKPLAGKTGTTNDYKDAWFVGFSPDLAVGVYVGFDQPRSLGSGEAGGRVAAPIFRDFMMDALEDEPPIPFRIPEDIRLVRVIHETGEAARGQGGQVIWEAFQEGTGPEDRRRITTDGSILAEEPTGGSSVSGGDSSSSSNGSTGGLY